MEINNDKLSTDLRTNTANIRTNLDNTSDLVIKYAKVAGCDICIITCEGMAGADTVAGLIYRPLEFIRDSQLTPDQLMDKLQNELLTAVDQHQSQTYDEISHSIMSGYAVILVDGVDYSTAIGVQGFKSRSVDKPVMHSNLRGSCEGFNEVLRTNIALVRRRLKSPTFVSKIHTIGDRSKTDVSVCYLKDKANPEMVRQIEARLQEIPVNTILEGGYIEPFLQDESNAIFSQVGVTDRPDCFAAKLYDGRIGVIVDGTPHALFLPLLFTENFQTLDDYSSLPIFTGFTRFLKYIAFAFTILLPGFYVAVANFNPELFPPAILFNIISAEQQTPFTILTECIIIHFIYEVMREAGLRLPAGIGHAVSIVGGLVLGDIVVSVGLISAPIVLLVALSAISSFIVPDLYPTVSILRFAFIFAGGLFGIFGLTALALAVLIKVCSMTSYGVPYMAPLTPFTLKGMRDYFVRVSWRKLAKSDVNINELTGVDRL
ncbi:MAG: spore germination protein [Oscillospiraceae bacterium]|nr:spore germination protein [Oscillospiraceae bacterium]